MTDARVGAWIAAHELLVAADKVLQEHQEVGFPIHALLVGRADVFARLASCSQEVGVTAGQYIYKTSQEAANRKSAFREAISKTKGRADDTTGATDTGLHSVGGDDPDSEQDDIPAEGSDG